MCGSIKKAETQCFTFIYLYIYVIIWRSSSLELHVNTSEGIVDVPCLCLSVFCGFPSSCFFLPELGQGSKNKGSDLPSHQGENNVCDIRLQINFFLIVLVLL